MSAHSAVNLASEPEPKEWSDGPSHVEVPRSEWPQEWEVFYRKSFPKTYPTHSAMRKAVAVCTHPDIDGTDRALLNVLAMNSSVNGHGARPGNEMLMASTGLKWSALHERIEKNCTRRLIQRTECPRGGSGLAAVYRICLESQYFPTWDEMKKKFNLGKKTIRSRPHGFSERKPSTQSNHPAQEKNHTVSDANHTVSDANHTVQKKNHTAQDRSTSDSTTDESTERTEESVRSTLSSNIQTVKQAQQRSTPTDTDTPPARGREGLPAEAPSQEERTQDFRKGFVVRYENRYGKPYPFSPPDWKAARQILKELSDTPVGTILSRVDEMMHSEQFLFRDVAITVEFFLKNYKKLYVPPEQSGGGQAGDRTDFKWLNTPWETLTADQRDEYFRDKKIYPPAGAPRRPSELPDWIPRPLPGEGIVAYHLRIEKLKDERGEDPVSIEYRKRAAQPDFGEYLKALSAAAAPEECLADQVIRRLAEDETVQMFKPPETIAERRHRELAEDDIENALKNIEILEKDLGHAI